MANNQQPLDEQLRLGREQAEIELAELRKMDESALTPRMLVRKAMLLQLENAPDGSPEEIEAALKAALDRDDRCIEAYIELGRYYYAILDDCQRAKAAFLRAVELLSGWNREVLEGLLDCDAELSPDRDHNAILTEYAATLVGTWLEQKRGENSGGTPRTGTSGTA